MGQPIDFTPLALVLDLEIRCDNVIALALILSSKKCLFKVWMGAQDRSDLFKIFSVIGLNVQRATVRQCLRGGIDENLVKQAPSMVAPFGPGVRMVNVQGGNRRRR